MARTLFLVFLAFAVPGCAVLNEKHRHIANYLDDNATPKDPYVKAAAAPVAIPAGLMALLIDGAVINPVLNLPKAFRNAKVVFDFEKVPLLGIGEIWAFPMRIITFVAIFFGSEIGRCLFPIEKYGGGRP